MRIPGPAIGQVPSDQPEVFRIVTGRGSVASERARDWREGTPSMVIRTATMDAPHPEAVEFVRFCYHRRRVGWPELYDEMCAVAGRGLFRGFSADDLGGIGVGFSLFDMPALANLSARVVAEEVALRRPVSVVIAPTAPAVTLTPAVAPAPVVAPTPVVGPATAPAPATVPAPTDERSFDVPVRLAIAPTGA
jgi:hypothetical protein